ncbi:hypothetical protein Ade02nite_20780 [Paractinoplanes deccanensis]|uniref:Uncharacterized protein n=1 Tax=Paractinoplanes deccanensis TaxID=113561 RepID=A0ABQ3Y0C7_9ACTN|nr:hypothetical protein [Actinoplanes deccanensis]GID73437.1 hypothetical protein Ade02nite_20780 [Actinoplanes deccanensis]
MNDIKAADLPDGSVVANNKHAFIKTHPTRTAQWRGTNGGFFGDWYIDELFTEGKTTVVREGY